MSRPHDGRSGYVPPMAEIATDACIGCWASNGHVSAVCLNLEQQLRTCMDSKVWICFGLGHGSNVSAGTAEGCQELDQQEPYSLLREFPRPQEGQLIYAPLI